MKYVTLLILIFCTSCTTIRCFEGAPKYHSSYYDGYTRYLFDKNVMPNEGYIELESFLPSKTEVSITDSVVSVTGLNLDDVKFAQYCGFLTDSGERIIVVKYVYKEIKDFPQARCNWFFGFGEFYEKYTRERYVNVVTKTPVEL